MTKLKQATSGYIKSVERHFPDSWPIRGFEFWVNFCFTHGVQPTIEEWEIFDLTPPKVPISYYQSMADSFPYNWPIEARSWWIRYNFQHHKEPTLDQWHSYIARKKRFNNLQASRRQKNMKAHLEGLSKLYGAVK